MAMNRVKNINIKKAFTLVEMLVALIILSIAVALVVGVGNDVVKSSRDEETRNIQAVVINALAMYHETHSLYPPGQGQRNSSADLLTALKKTRKAKQVLKNLPQNAIWVDDKGTEHIVDGYGVPMQYHRTGGLAAKTPALISQGADPKDTTDDIETEMN